MVGYTVQPQLTEPSIIGKAKKYFLKLWRETSDETALNLIIEKRLIAPN